VVDAVRHLKEMPGGELYVGGVTLPRALVAAGLIDEYEFIVQPTVAGHGLHLLADLPTPLMLTPMSSRRFCGGAVATTHAPTD
jgi:dihydrofolate reductase